MVLTIVAGDDRACEVLAAGLEGFLLAGFAAELSGQVEKLLGGDEVDSGVSGIRAAEGAVVGVHAEGRGLRDCSHFGAVAERHAPAHVSVTHRTEQMQWRQPRPQPHSPNPHLGRLRLLLTSTFLTLHNIHGEKKFPSLDSIPTPSQLALLRIACSTEFTHQPKPGAAVEKIGN
jgi:hypothetical protein